METIFRLLVSSTLVLMAGRVPSQPIHASSTPAAVLLPSNLQGVPQLGELNRSWQREMKGGERDQYQLALLAGQFVSVLVDQDGIDVTVSLVDPEGHQITQVDSENAEYGPEPVVAIAETAGLYKIIVASDAASQPGRYSIRVLELRSSAPGDEQHVAAERSIEKGMSLSSSGQGKDREAALAHFMEALRYYEASKDDYRHGLLLFSMGSLLARVSRFQEVLDYDTRALALFKASSSPTMVADTLNSIGGAYNRLGEVGKAMRFHQEALASIPADKGLQLRGNTLNNIGELYSQMSDSASALDYYQQAVKIFTRLKDSRTTAIGLHNVANTYRNMGEQEKALEFFEQSLAFWQLAHDRAGESSTFTEMSKVLASLGLTERARKTCQRALELDRLVGDPGGEASALYVQGQILRLLHRPEEAEKALLASLEKETAIHDQRGSGLTQQEIGNLYMELFRPEAAHGYYAQALALFNSLRDTQFAARSMLGLARAERASGNFDESLRQAKNAIQSLEQVRSSIPTEDLRASYLGSGRSFYEFYLDLTLHFPRQIAPEGNQALAFQIAEMARARSLLDTLSGSGAGLLQDGDAEREVKQEIAAQGSRLLELRLQGRPADASAIDRSIHNLEAEYDRLKAEKVKQDHGASVLSQPRFLTAAEVQQKLLDEQTILLEYFLGTDKSYLWAISSREVAVFELPPQARIEDASRKFLGLMRNRAASAGNARAAELRREASELSTMLLSPVAGRLADRRLIIVADGALQYVPFAALEQPQTAHSPVTTYTPLVLTHEIVNVPSASAFAAQRELLANQPPAPRTLAVLADPVFAQQDPRVGAKAPGRSSLHMNEQMSASRSVERLLEHAQSGASPASISRLPFTAIEADKIFAMTPAGTSMKAMGFAATRSLALSPELGQYRYLHFATHGYMDAGHPELSAVVLSLVDKTGNSIDGFLRLQDIYNLRLQADLVVLSACETGLGREIRGEGLIGLTRGFMYAGAARVLVSLWDVSDQGTSELMPRFYKGLLEQGLSPAAALRQAQIAMLKSRQWQAPYYWAPFTLQGEWK
jgi:CHAT domain-containing protein